MFLFIHLADCNVVHSQYYGEELNPHFWTLIEALDEGSRRWFSASSNGNGRACLAGSFAVQLRQLYSQLQEDPNCRLDVQGSPEWHQPTGRSQSRLLFDGNPFSNLDTMMLNFGPAEMSCNGAALQQPQFGLASPKHHNTNISQGTTEGIDAPSEIEGVQADDDTDNLADLLDFLGDQSFTNLDRIISYADINSYMLGLDND